MPYSSQGKSAFWKTCRESQDFLAERIFRPAHPLTPGDRIATAGSCFAQNIGTYVKASNLAFVDVEPAPYGMPPDVAKRYGFDLFSARYGNIYTGRQLRQLLADCITGEVHDAAIWTKGGAFFDGIRPNIEPEGYASADEARAHRRDHLNRVRSMFENTDVFVFTLGLTETWQHRQTGVVFPSAPGVIAGAFDPAQHSFVNLRFADVMEDMTMALDILRDFASDMRVLLTVSPVPLTATATVNHVLSATTYSKSVLRAVAEELTLQHSWVEYFPSYELVTGAPFIGQAYSSNLRTVRRAAVDRVMSVFFGAYEGIETDGLGEPARVPEFDFDDLEEADALICEEMLLEVFADK